MAQLECDVEALANPEFVEQADVECEHLAGGFAVFRVEVVGEAAGQVTESGVGHRIINAVIAVAADPVREVYHSVHMEEQIGPFDLFMGAVGHVGKFTALKTQTGAENGMNPLGYGETRGETDPVSVGSRVVATDESRAGAGACRDLPVIPKTVRLEAGDTFFLFLRLRHSGFRLSPNRGRKQHACERKE